MIAYQLPRITEIVKTKIYGEISVTIIGDKNSGKLGNMITLHDIGKKKSIYLNTSEELL